MMPDVEVIIAWAGDCPYRARALAWVLARIPYPVRLAHGPSNPWIKARAVMPAVEQSKADVIVLHDADVWTEGLQEAVEAVQEGHPWAIPHQEVYRLSADATETVLDGHDPELVSAIPACLDRPPYVGMAGGGILVARRSTLLGIPLDPRFVGWSGEDESHAMALSCLVGDPWRGTAPLVHLWHEPQPRLTRRMGSQANWNLRNRYARARDEPGRMGELLREAKRDRQSFDTPGDDREAIGGLRGRADL
jgi:hypothetical protein